MKQSCSYLHVCISTYGVKGDIWNISSANYYAVDVVIKWLTMSNNKT